MKLDMSQKKYLIVGASSGIGRAIAIAVSQYNGQAVLVGRNENNLIKTKDMMNGANHIIMPYDITNIDGIKVFVKMCMDKVGGRFDGLVFSAGVGRVKPIRAENIEDLRNFYELSYLSYVALLKEFSSKRVLNDYGSIIAISSRSALFPEKGYLGYATAKEAINTASLVAAQELANRGVRVNTICPEMTKTPLTKYFFDTVSKEQLAKFYPLGYLEPEDVADTALFLLSDMSKKLTGQKIYLSAANTGSAIEYFI